MPGFRFRRSADGLTAHGLRVVRCLKQWGRSWGSHVAIRRVAFVELFAVKNTWSHSYFDGADVVCVGADCAPGAMGCRVGVRRTYKFRMRPTARQHVALATCLEAHRELYNAALQERRDAWRHRRAAITYGTQSDQLKDIRRDRADVAIWSFSSQQATLRRLNRAFDGFFRRVKAGAAPGYPRFKGRGRFDSVEWPKDGDGARWHPDTNRVYLRGIGQVKVSAHRQVFGRVKTIQVRREGRRWVLILSCDDVAVDPLPATGRQVGVDMGIASFATTSDGVHISNPRWGRRAAARLTRAQQSLARAKRGSNNRKRRRETVAARHRKIANQRRDFHHKTARALVASYDLVVVEDLAIANMRRRAKPLPDPDEPGAFLPNESRRQDRTQPKHQ